MSEASKKTLSAIQNSFEEFMWDLIADEIRIKSLNDLGLSQRMQKVQESIKDVIQYIEDRGDGAI